MQKGGGGGGRTQTIALIVLSLVSLYLTLSFMELSKDVATMLRMRQMRGNYKLKPVKSYCECLEIWHISRSAHLDECTALVGTDHPMRLPVERKFVKMFVEESVHYDILADESQQEWLWTASIGDGHTHIGEQQRYFAVAMFHELHCLRAVRGVFEKGWQNIPKDRQYHLLHCFNYLRQYTLCAADTALEPGDFTLRNFTKQRVGATHTCINWDPAYEFMKDSWIKWNEYREAHGIPWHDDVT